MNGRKITQTRHCTKCNQSSEHLVIYERISDLIPNDPIYAHCINCLPEPQRITINVFLQNIVDRI